MAIIVQKFGGTSVGTVDLIRKVALRVKYEVDQGHQVVVVVSAMSGVTNQLIEHIHNITTTYDRTEYDVIASSGEQITSGLLALALQNIGVPARSWLGWQIPILTSDTHAHGKILEIHTASLLQDLKKGVVSVIAGFQGLSSQGRITTLGRGGSDTTAVALAAALKAERCDIYTDVDGVYTADPRTVSSAGKIDQIAYHEMLELASHGAKVLQRDSVEFAMRHNVRLRVLSAHAERPSGTLITGDHEIQTSPQAIRGVAHTLQEGQITLKGLPAKPEILTLFHEMMKTAQIEIDMLTQDLLPCGRLMDCHFTALKAELDRTEEILKLSQKKLNFYDLLRNNNVAKISIVGSGLKYYSHVARKLFKKLAEDHIKVSLVSCSDIKLSVLIPANETEKAVSALHGIYELDDKGKR
ncbi:aspartate kinase [Candidatus Bealeia paramacronuclearis]